MLTKPDTVDPEREYASPDEKATALAVTLTMPVGDGSLVMQTYLARDDKLSTYNALLDKMDAAMRRQSAKRELEVNEANLAIEEKTLAQLKEDFNAIEPRSIAAHESSGRKGQWKLSPQEAQQKSGAMTNIQRYVDAIKKRKDDMARLRALIG